MSRDAMSIDGWTDAGAWSNNLWNGYVMCMDRSGILPIHENANHRESTLDSHGAKRLARICS